jgi:predicted MFS family arabinose efflux permease
MTAVAPRIRPGLTRNPAIDRWRGQDRSAAWHVMKRPPFAAYFAGSFVSNMGTWLQNTAQMLIAYQLTRSALAVGAITCAQFSGFLVLGPWAGGLADRMGARRVLIGTQLVSAVIAAVLARLAFERELTEHELLVCAVAMGVAFTFALPVQTAMIHRLVRNPDDTRAAMAMNSVAYNAGRTIAPVLCVVVIETVGSGWAFALNAVSFGVFAAVLLAICPQGMIQRRRGSDWTGMKVARQRPRILLLLVMVATVTIADDPVLVLGPPLARQVLKVSSVWPAFFLSALGLGTVLGALLPIRPAASIRAASDRAAKALLILALSVILFTIGWAPWLSLIAAGMAGAAALLTGAASQALLLRRAGLDQAAQVMALWAVAWAGTKPLASLLDGWLASRYGVFCAGVVLASPALVVASCELWLPERCKQRIKDFAQERFGLNTNQSVKNAAFLRW